MRRAAKVDVTQVAIVGALRRIGCHVLHLHQVGQGCPDLLVHGAGRTFLMEVKSPGEKVNAAQADFIAKWPGEVAVVRTPEEAVRAVLGEAALA